VHYADIQREMEARGAGAALREFRAQLRQIPGSRNLRTALAVPLVRDGGAVGALTLYQYEQVRPFSAHEIALAETFAEQAVIAIENARLFAEQQESNATLREALEQQTATAEVLSIISRSPTDVEPVLTAVVERAARLCGAVFARIWRVEGEMLRTDAAWIDERIRVLGIPTMAVGDLVPLDANSLPAQAILGAHLIHLPDVLAEPDGMYELIKDAVRQNGARSRLAVPLLREGTVIGVIHLGRLGVGSFTPQQIALVETFADQAVIAIENARLFEEIEAKSRELEQLNAQLAVASSRKSEYVANMSHELRTPLNAIIGYAELLQEVAEEQQQTEFISDLEKINTAARHLLSLINDILDLSKIEAGRLELVLEEIDVPALVRDVEAVVQPLVDKNGNTLQVDCPSKVGTLHADLTKVRQSLLNLLSNAAKFTEQGTITLAVSGHTAEDGAWLSFSVADTGIGMTEAQLSRLFEPFGQAEATTQARYGGTGLGLALSREYCRLMGGDITVTSAPGEGSRFTITLPRQVAQPSA
jgi:signal transduction histidine kinase